MKNLTFHQQCRQSLALAINQAVAARILCSFQDDPELSELIQCDGFVQQQCRAIADRTVDRLIAAGALPPEPYVIERGRAA